ncbi:unnamed protein product, partial [Arabidopsis halleri]
ASPVSGFVRRRGRAHVRCCSGSKLSIVLVGLQQIVPPSLCVAEDLGARWLTWWQWSVPRPATLCLRTTRGSGGAIDVFLPVGLLRVMVGLSRSASIEPVEELRFHTVVLRLLCSPPFQHQGPRFLGAWVDFTGA